MCRHSQGLFGVFAPVAAAALFAATAATFAVRAAEPALKPVPADAPPPAFEKDVKPLLARYCVECHQGDKAKGGIAFEKFGSDAAALKNRKTWERVAENLESEAMPPAEKPQPTEAERALLLRWIESRVLNVSCDEPIDPGRVTIRRLNRAEYDNTIRDLLGVDVRAADEFPSDDVGYGFDNIGDVLSVPPILLEKYLAAAEKITDAAIVTPDADRAQRETKKGRTLASNGEIGIEFESASGGEYIFCAKAWAQQAGPDLAKMTLCLDGQDVQTVDVKSNERDPRDYDVRLAVGPGKHRFAAKFINDYYKPDDPDPNNRDRNLIIEQLELSGPIGVLPKELPESHRRLLTSRPEDAAHVADCARTILRPFAMRAFRRPATDDEINRLVRLVESAVAENDSFERGIQLAVQAVLVSPHFLFRIEIDPDPMNPQAVRTLNDFELATRLSYFLWSTMPDDELFRLASEGTLRKEGNLAAQVKRMLKDPRSGALIENFAAQWLHLRLLKTIQPDPKQFPGFDEELRSAMATETKLFFETLIREDRSLFDLLDADFTFVNERLAKHYGIEGIQGPEFRRIAVLTDHRGGLLGQASVLMVTSNPTRTSPVKRGKWILENLLGAPPPPPPPGVPELSEEKDKVLSGTLRQRMEQHRANPACAVCHAQMDALGFGLENYDPIGGWRTMDGTFPIDAGGSLPGGESFSSPAELKAILKSRHNEFRRCVAEKLLTYALGRGLEYHDKCAVDQIVKNVAAGNDRFSALVMEIVAGDPFQKRRGKRGDEP